jgi:hypothetical protein
MFGVHHVAGQSRDCKADSGAAFARRYRSETRHKTGTSKGTSAQDVGSQQEKDRGGAARTVGEDYKERRNRV